MTRASRAAARKDFTPDTRITLLEDDADGIEGTVAGIQKSMQRLSATFTAAAITFGTSALLLAANLIIPR